MPFVLGKDISQNIQMIKDTFKTLKNNISATEVKSQQQQNISEKNMSWTNIIEKVKQRQANPC
jgi:hypothetical protein